MIFSLSLPRLEMKLSRRAAGRIKFSFACKQRLDTRGFYLAEIACGARGLLLEKFRPRVMGSFGGGAATVFALSLSLSLSRCDIISA